MKVLIAPDKFKGTLSATEAAAAMAEGVARFNPSWQVVQLPIADGGEGTAEVLTRASGGQMIRCRASDPLLRQVACEYGVSADGGTAFIDLASASGIDVLELHEINALKTSTAGTGEIIVHAINRKCKRIIIGLGGSATIDCGIGIAHALGAVYANDTKDRISPIGVNLSAIEFIHLDNLRPELKRIEILLLTDVDNLLLGEDGAMRYATQKGLPLHERAAMQAALEHFANLIEAQFNLSSKIPGMGAAGGAALSCIAILGAKMTAGAAFVMEALHLPQAIADADLVLTGEGHLDEQSLHGKAPVALARLAQTQGKYVAAICGQVSLAESAQRQAGIDLATGLFPVGVDIESVRKHVRAALVERTVEVLREMAPKLGE